jgi:hypothetical protein
MYHFVLNPNEVYPFVVTPHPKDLYIKEARRCRAPAGERSRASQPSTVSLVTRIYPVPPVMMPVPPALVPQTVVINTY